MARFNPAASFAVVTQKDGSFAVEVREPRRVVPLRITGYASEAEATAAIAGFTAAEALAPSLDPVSPAKPNADIAAKQAEPAKKPAKPTAKRKRAGSGKSRKR
jgi:hypothetical protein